MTLKFYTSCYRALPNAGSPYIFPGGWPEDDPAEIKIKVVAPYVASISICLAGVLSLAVAYVHLRTPCWDSEMQASESQW
jgi:hypothetical protein